MRRRISLTGQFASVDEDLTARENLALLARLHGYPVASARQRAADLLDAFDLADAAGRLAGQLSGGMRRRLDIAASIVVRPDLLFLDEPTTGLDPRSRSQSGTSCARIVAEGTTVLLTTQYLDEADQLADRIAVIDHGRVIASGTRGELKSSVGAGGVRVRLSDPGQRDRARRSLADSLGTPAHPDGDPAQPAQPDSSDDQQDSTAIALRALSRLTEAGIAVSDFSLGQPSLDEVFLALTGTPGRHRHPHRHPHRCDHRPARRPPHDRVSVRPPGTRPARGRLAHVRLAVGAQDQARTRAARRRHRHPGPVHAAVHLPLRRRARRLDPRLPAVPAARHARPGRRVRHRLQRRDP